MIYFTSLIFFLSTFLLPTTEGTAASERSKIATQKNSSIAAIVNGKAILSSDVMRRAKLITISGGGEKSKITDQLLQDVLKIMIDEQLQIQFCDEHDIKADAQEIEQAFKNLEHQNGMPEGGLNKFLSSNGLSRRVLEDQLKASIVWRKYIQGRFANLAQVSAAEVAAVKKRQEQAKNEPRYLLSEIVLPVRTTKDSPKVRKRAETVHRQLMQGASFPMLAQQVAQMPRGGDIGWIPRGQLDPEICQALDKTPVGQVCGPIRTKDGYVIAQLRDHQKAGQEGTEDTLIHFHQAFFPVSMLAREDEVRQLYERITSISQNAHSGSTLKKLSKSIKGHRYQDVAGISARQLPPPLQNLLAKLPVGQASPAIQTEGGFIIFLVENRRKVLSGQMSEEDIKLKLVGDKLENISRQQLAGLRGRAFVDIRI